MCDPIVSVMPALVGCIHVGTSLDALSLASQLDGDAPDERGHGGVIAANAD